MAKNSLLMENLVSSVVLKTENIAERFVRCFITLEASTIRGRWPGARKKAMVSCIISVDGKKFFSQISEI